MGYGPRSDAAARGAVEDVFGCEALALELADKRFYHMDTALAPLPGGEVMYLPEAFTAAGRPRSATGSRGTNASDRHRGRLPAGGQCRLPGSYLVVSDCSERLRAELAERGYEVVTTPLPSFLRSGGSAFCLTLRLDRQSVPVSAAVNHSAVA